MLYFTNFIKQSFFCCIILLISNTTNSQSNEKKLKSHVIQLSSKKFEGRGLNSKGIRHAEKYILSEINKFNLSQINNTYRQEFSIKYGETSEPKNPILIINNDTLRYKNEFFTLGNNTKTTNTLPLYTINNLNQQKINIDCALIVDDVNKINDIKSPFVKILLIISLDSINYKQIINSNISGEINVQNNKHFEITPKIQTYYLNPTASKNIKEIISSTPNTPEITFSTRNNNTTDNTANLFGIIEGSSGDSTLVISAHYDHIGIRNGKINPGANDNASGVSALLEIARVLSEEKYKPKYNILFCFFSAEESGLCGSRYFINNPLIQKETIIANINLDMIGNKDKLHKSTPNFIYAFGPEETSSFLMTKIDSINQSKSFLTLDYFDHDTHMGKRFLQMSDQANFINSDIPALFLFNGLSPNYHKPKDTHRKLDYKKMKNVCDLTIDLIKDLAH